MRQKKIISIILFAVMLLSCCGCKSEPAVQTQNRVVELVEPVNAVADTETVEYRNIYQAVLYSANVYPTVREYSFDSSTKVEEFGAFLGESVKKGEALVYGSTENLDKQIEALEERIATMDENMVKAQQDLSDNLAVPKSEVWWREDIVENFERIKPLEFVYESVLQAGTVSDGDSEDAEAEEKEETEKKPDRLVRNPEYAKWWKEARVHIGNYKILVHSINVQEENFRQKKVLYEMERTYYVEQLEDLKKKRNQNILTSRAKGEVVAIAERQYGSYNAAAEEPIVAVGNANEKVIKCEFINKAVISKAADVYALIDGIRYEIEYQPLEGDSYAKLASDGEKVYSTFVFQGDCEQVQVGDFALITVFEQKREQVLSVPKSALRKDESGYYVYVMKDGEGVVTPVKTGLSDGTYTEITAGLSQGDKVLVENPLNYSDKTVILEKGSFHSTFENRGAMYYPITEGVYNPVEYGTTYFGEYQVALYERVKKGDVIATIRVATDDIALQRNRTKLQRAQERLADLIAADQEDNEEIIRAKQEEIAEMQELLAQMEADGATKKIVAPRSGIVVDMVELDKETILNYEAHLAEIADVSTCYVVVENTNQQLNYGDEVTITYTNSENQQKTSSGVVANMSHAGIGSALRSENAYILLPEENIADMAVSNTNGNEWWNRLRYNVSANIREMDNVVSVPRNAVWEVNGNTYVYVKDEQGNVKTQSFVAGGFDSTSYWVVEGLSEGMEICLE